jgi:hypothetical protein
MLFVTSMQSNSLDNKFAKLIKNNNKWEFDTTKITADQLRIMIDKGERNYFYYTFILGHVQSNCGNLDSIDALPPQVQERHTIKNIKRNIFESAELINTLLRGEDLSPEHKSLWDESIEISKKEDPESYQRAIEELENKKVIIKQSCINF